MYKIDFTNEIEHFLLPFEDFVKELLEFINKDSNINRAKQTDKDKIQVQLNILLGELKNIEEYSRLAKVAAKTKLKFYIYELKFEVDDIEEIYTDITMKYKQILNGNETLSDLPVFSPVVKEAFEYIYEKFVRSKSFSEHYCYNNVSDPMHQLRIQMTEREMCPYCNMTRMEFDLSSIDHFLPKAKFPLLSIFPKNLVIACTACNDRIKKEKFHLPIVHPYFDNINDYFIFSFDFTDKIISTKLNGELNELEQKRIQNYLDLFQISYRYNKYVSKDIIKFIKNIREEVKKNINKVNLFSKEIVTVEFLERIKYEREKIEVHKNNEHFSKIKLDVLNFLENEGKEIEIEHLCFISIQSNTKRKNFLAREGI